jgi:hypothetical protein
MSLMSVHAQRIGANDESAKPAVADEAIIPVFDMAALDRYLARTAPGRSPLDRLSPPAKRRFLVGFRDEKFSTAELEAELTRDETLAVLKLFGAESHISSVTARSRHLSIGASETVETSAAFDALLAATNSSRGAGVAEYAKAFASRQSQIELRRRSDGDVALFFRAAMYVADADPDGRDASDLLRDLAELERRGVAAPGWIKGAYRMLVQMRNFAGARAFRDSHPDANLPLLPEFRDAAHGDGPTVLVLSPDGRELVRRTVALDPKAQVVVVAGCHLSDDAARDIENDPVMRAAFSNHVLWITPAVDDPADPALLTWNREHPLAAMSTVYRESEWRDITSWNTPTFYFFRGGRLEGKISGWRDQRDAVLDAFRKVGLAP